MIIKINNVDKILNKKNLNLLLLKYKGKNNDRAIRGNGLS
jgi:hypothetical protein